MKLISPSLLSADFANLERDVKALEQAGADWLHVDVMDGQFVPNLTIGVPVVAALKKIATKPLDVHLMIEKPENLLMDFIKAGADYLTLHVESTRQIERCLQTIRHEGRHAGITLRPRTPVTEVLPYLHLCDLVLVMTVEPGFGGQSFMADQVEKISTLRKVIHEKDLSTLIEVDGGISDQTAVLCHEADVFVAGSYIFKNDMKMAIQKLKEF